MIDNVYNCRKVKALIDFDKSNSNRIKLLAVIKNRNVKITSKFMNEKMLKFSKISLASFIYDIIEVFAFPDDNTRGIFSKLNIIKCYLYLHLADTDSIYFQFVFICKVY